jgi:hypothetical protein
MVTEIMAAPYTSLNTYTGLAMEAVRTSMLPRARNNVQKLVILLADGLSADRMLLYSDDLLTSTYFIHYISCKIVQ